MATNLLSLHDEHSGRDEMNLAGHPFALLQTPKRHSETSIFYEWQRRLENGREVMASWRVGTDAAIGLPGPEEELLYLVLLQLTREAAEAAGTPREWPLTVRFSRGDVLRRLGWGNGARRYAALELAFNRLVAVSITAKYAFYDARTRAPINAVGFHILNEFSLVEEPSGRKAQNNIPLSHFEWNTTLHTSFIAGNVRSLALDFAISLQHPTARRLFRLLDLLRYASKPPRPQLSMGLFKLRDRLGMTDYRHPSQIAQKLAPAVAELTERGYLAGMTVEKGASGEKLAIFRFGDVFRIINPTLAPLPAPAPEKPAAARQSPPRALVIPDLGPRSLPDAPNADDAARDARLDAVYDALSEAERADIEARALESLAPFLRENLQTSGAQGDLARARRREVSARTPTPMPSRISQ